MTRKVTSGSTEASVLGVALGALSAAVFAFGTTFALLAYQGGSNALTVVVLRIIVYVALVGGSLALSGRSMRLPRRALLATVWMAANLSVVSLGYQGSVAYIPVNLAALTFYTFPLLVGLLSVLSGRDRMTARNAIALVAAFVGLALVLGPNLDGLDWRGLALAFSAAVAMGLMLTFGGEATRGQDVVLMSVYTNLQMLIVLGAIAIGTGSIALPTSPSGVASTLGACVTYVAAYVCWYLALKFVKPVRLATLLNIEPLATLLVAWLVLGESLSPQQILGATLVLGSTLSATLPSNKEDKQLEPAG
jgi:drug/metabolite transporter (DMT)-like permease